jgi:D-sedoheptulose 7-phosphate isomerase
MPDEPANAVVESLLEAGQLATTLARTIAADLQAAVTLIADSILAGGKTLACGNGGSAAEAQHFAGEMVGRFLFNRPAVAGIALNTDTSILTAIGNDYGYEKVFSRQVEALGRAGDVLLGFSTSGTSANVILAFETARGRGLKTIAMIGAAKPPALEMCDVCFCIPSEATPRIQEMHMAIMHAICERVETRLFARGGE